MNVPKHIFLKHLTSLDCLAFITAPASKLIRIYGKVELLQLFSRARSRWIVSSSSSTPPIWKWVLVLTSGLSSEGQATHHVSAGVQAASRDMHSQWGKNTAEFVRVTHLTLFSLATFLICSPTSNIPASGPVCHSHLLHDTHPYAPQGLGELVLPRWTCEPPEQNHQPVNAHTSPKLHQ